MNVNENRFSRPAAPAPALDPRVWLARSLLVQVLVLALIVSIAGPAPATPTTVRVSGSSSFDGNPSKSTSVSCPQGKRLVGAGAALRDGGPDVRVYQITPNAALTGLTVRALASVDPAWGVTAYGICTSFNLPGLERKTFITGADSQTSKSATAECSDGKRLLGTGGLVSGGVSNVLIDDILPHSTLDKVTVWGVEGQGGTADTWTVTGIAICASVSSLEVSRVLAESSYDSTAKKSATATCPNGTVMLGTGAELLNGGGQVKIDAIAPNGSSTTSPTANTVKAMEDLDGTNANWRVKSFAICFTLPAT